MPELQRKTTELLSEVMAIWTVRTESAPNWLARPGRAECGHRWHQVIDLYRDLTGLDLPDVMPVRERRRVDAVISTPGEPPRLFEFDESQHFNRHRARTLRRYPPDLAVAFPLDAWLRMSDASTRPLSTTGGWGRAKPPLFPEPGGRHLQRAYRDALADLLPDVHGWAPTLRIADVEVAAWIDAPGAAERLHRLVTERLATSTDTRMSRSPSVLET